MEHHDKKNPTKPWFNSECRYKRKLFLKARKRSVQHKSNIFIQQERKKQAKEYKLCVKREFKKYQAKLAKKLRFLKCNDPKKYWSIINETNSASKGFA